MKVLGLKLTHDGSYSVIDNNNLIITYELEKYDNNNRYKILNSLEDLDEILKKEGFNLMDFDSIVIDGWIGLKTSKIQLIGDNKYDIKVAPYRESIWFKDISQKLTFQDLVFNKKRFEYSSYTHATGHILSSYMTSEFSKNKQDSYILIWDGGLFPSLYYIDGNKHEINPIGEIFYLGVNIYSIFAQHFGPFKVNPNVIKDELSISGKVMAYIAYGKHENEILNDLTNTYKIISKGAKKASSIPLLPYYFTETFIKISKGKKYSHENILTTFHNFLGDLLLKKTREKILSDDKRSTNLCYAGGAALNIKWNSLLREGLNMNLWIPPFPNDSGSSIGAACSEIFFNHKINHINWNVYSGSKLSIGDIDFHLTENWISEDCNLIRLAKILHNTNEPIVFLNSNSEIGPRSLGNRSILSTAINPEQKNKINTIKYREEYRPVAPVCIEEKSHEIFYPGGRDPYMLYEHFVHDSWASKIPAAVHIDGSSRLQTITQIQNKFLYDLLIEYEKISGIPVLLNSSANLKGSGFFPDISSAMNWGKAKYIWSNYKLYTYIK